MSGREGNERGRTPGRRVGDPDSRRGLTRSSQEAGRFSPEPEEAGGHAGQSGRGRQGTPRNAKGRGEGRFHPPARPGKGPRARGAAPYGPDPEDSGRQASLSGRDSGGFQAPAPGRPRGSLFQDKRPGEKKFPLFERPKWAAPALSTEPISHPDCPYCGKPIRDMSTAIADKDSGEPVHFECVAARIAEGETLEKGDVVTYLGGGRFGVVHFPGIIRDALRGRKSGGEYETKNFHIKKIVEWENKENRSPWRKNIEEHFSVV